MSKQNDSIAFDLSLKIEMAIFSKLWNKSSCLFPETLKLGSIARSLAANENGDLQQTLEQFFVFFSRHSEVRLNCSRSLAGNENGDLQQTLEQFFVLHSRNSEVGLNCSRSLAENKNGDLQQTLEQHSRNSEV